MANYCDERSIPMVEIGESSSSSRDGTMQVPQGNIDKSLPNDDETHDKFGNGTPPPPPPPPQHSISLESDVEQGRPPPPLTPTQMERNSDPNDDEMDLGKIFLAITGQAIVSLMTYPQNGTSSYLAKTNWASNFVKAGIAVGFIVSLTAIFLHRKKKLVAADVFQIIGIIATKVVVAMVKNKSRLNVHVCKMKNAPTSLYLSLYSNCRLLPLVLPFMSGELLAASHDCNKPSLFEYVCSMSVFLSCFCLYLARFALVCFVFVSPG